MDSLVQILNLFEEAILLLTRVHDSLKGPVSRLDRAEISDIIRRTQRIHKDVEYIKRDLKDVI